jgi:hypothetical protein
MRRSLRLFGVAVLALCLGACTSMASTTDRVAHRVTVSPAPRPAVEGLTIAEPAWQPDGSDWALALRWEAPAGTLLDHYEVWRDGRPLDEQVPGLVWTDRRVEPGTRYEYAVLGVTADGVRTQPSRSTIRTDTPPVADARLDGSFVMVMHVEEAQGTGDPVQGGRVVFRFAPDCARGACSVVWTVRERDTHMTLARDGAIYSDRARTPLLIRNCFGDEIDERVLARFRVVGATSRRGRWQATKIEGTVSERVAWKGCTTASIVWSVRGTVR